MVSKIDLKVLCEKNNVDDLATAANAPIDMASVWRKSDAFPQLTIKARILKNAQIHVDLFSQLNIFRKW